MIALSEPVAEDLDPYLHGNTGELLFPRGTRSGFLPVVFLWRTYG
jgi:hypothetical protein